MAFQYGTELPTFAPSSLAVAVDRYDLAHAKTQIAALDTHTIPAGEQYIISNSLDIQGSLIIDGSLVVIS